MVVQGGLSGVGVGVGAMGGGVALQSVPLPGGVPSGISPSQVIPHLTEPRPAFAGSAFVGSAISQLMQPPHHGLQQLQQFQQLQQLQQLQHAHSPSSALCPAAVIS